MGFTEIFVSTHNDALKRAAALDGGAPGSPAAVRIPGISDFEIERLGELAGSAVHASGADYGLTMVDVASDSLLGVPDAMVRVLADLLSYETEGEGNVLEEVATAWSGEEDMPFGAAQALVYVRRIAELAAGVDPATRAGLYVWAA